MNQPLHLFILLGFLGCAEADPPPATAADPVVFDSIAPAAAPVSIGAIATPPGYSRGEVTAGSFAAYLRNFPLSERSEVLLFNGARKHNQGVHHAILDIDVGDNDLQQCADATIRLRSEYLLESGRETAISWELTNGMAVPWSRWRDGERVRVSGNSTNWYAATGHDDTYANFRRYLKFIFTYAGTLSLDRELREIAATEILPGDLVIWGGSPGHAVIVVDMAERDGERVMLLAQSYMPAQDIHILKNLRDPELNPWYRVSDLKGTFHTAEYIFTEYKIRRF